MEKVHLALEMAGLTAEKTKLENDCRESASEFKTMEVSAATHSQMDILFYTEEPVAQPSFNFSLQQRCSRLDQRKVQLTEQCKGLLKRAKSNCRMQQDEALSEDLRHVSVPPPPPCLLLEHCFCDVAKLLV